MGAAVLLGAFASLRVAEACGLRPGDVDFMRAVIGTVEAVFLARTEQGRNRAGAL
jgi:integrase